MTRVRFESLAFGGEAVGRDPEGRVVFASLGAPGELAEVRVRETRPRFVRAELVDILEPSPVRVAPQCPYFSRCGG